MVPKIPSSEEKKRLYELSLEQINATVDGETDAIAILSSAVCILKLNLPHAYWTGFYRVDPQRPGELVVGPYQGTLGCLRISFGKGVCGTCAERRETVIVADVHQFPGHIACDSASQSEMVVPVFDRNDNLIAVFDLDSAYLDAWSEEDKDGVEAILNLIKPQL
jgi:GAF domain-containing protein